MNSGGVRVYIVRGAAVMLDGDLAGIYGVTVAILNRAVGRNSRRFPERNAFWLTQEERGDLAARNGDRLPGTHSRVFNQDGAVALAFVLQSPEAVAASIRIINAVVDGHEHPLAVMFGAAFGAVQSATERDPMDDSAFYALPELVALDKHKRSGKAKTRKGK